MIKIDYDNQNKMTVALDGDKIVGRCTYFIKDDMWHLDHTIVDKNYGGQGIAGLLVKRLTEEAEKVNVKIVPICSYAVKYYEKHKEYESLIVGK